MLRKSSKQSGPTTRFGRQIAYDREIFISICRRYLEGEDFRDICANPPMPFRGWVEDHAEARAIYRSVENFISDHKLAKVLRVPIDDLVSDWATRVRANCERGWRADSRERPYMRPDWNNAYTLVGVPPVWSTENIESYNKLLEELTQLLEPRDMIEVMRTKEAADASWEAVRIAREKKRFARAKVPAAAAS